MENTYYSQEDANKAYNGLIQEYIECIKENEKKLSELKIGKAKMEIVSAIKDHFTNSDEKANLDSLNDHIIEDNEFKKQEVDLETNIRVLKRVIEYMKEENGNIKNNFIGKNKNPLDYCHF